MKKEKIYKVVSISCCFVFLICFFFGQTLFKHKADKDKKFYCSNSLVVNAQNESNLYLDELYTTQYFSKLTDNFGVNEMGSCGYVALGMLMTYYDTYCKDSFVAEQFEEKASLSNNYFSEVIPSAGAKSEKNLLAGITGNESYADGNDYYNRIVVPNASSFLHLNLIQLGNSLNYYDSSAGRGAGGLTNTELIQLTDNYLYTDRGFDRNEIKLEVEQQRENETLDSANVRISPLVVDKVMQGIPVLIATRVSENSSSAHAMIAYDWDGSRLYVHTGWMSEEGGETQTHVALTSLPYQQIMLAISLDINMEHNCTDNNVYTNGDIIKSYCPCVNYRDKVVFRNLTCIGANGYAYKANTLVTESNPVYYVHGIGNSIENVTARVATYGYDPYHIFLGWYTDTTFTNKVEYVPENARGDFIVYAKWRVDYGWLAIHGERTVTSAGVMSNASDQIYVGSVEELRQLQSMGITKLTISFHINMWEVKDSNKAIQYIYLYGGAGGNTQLASTTFNVTSSKEVKCVRFTVNISDLEENPYVYIRYNASTSGWLIKKSDDWKNNERFVEISYVVDESDITGEDAADFIWRYENSLVLKCSNCK